jgi:hypothetical protein
VSYYRKLCGNTEKLGIIAKYAGIVAAMMVITVYFAVITVRTLGGRFGG